MKIDDLANAAPTPPYPPQEQDAPGSDADLRPKADHGEDSYVGHDRLSGKRALVTGADSGIGRAVALAFAREGADIAIAYFEEEDDARETARLVEDAGRKARLFPGDIAAAAHCRELAVSAREWLGGLDILVNNAAHQRTFERIEDIPDDEFVRTFEVNVFGMFYLCKALLPQLPEGGSIVNTASIQSFDPSPNLLAYAATKAAIVNFTKSLAGLAIERGVRVNAVAPGPVWTPLIPATMPREKVEHFGENTAFGRAAQPGELAPLFVFLASAEASYVTGETFGATGGRMPL